MTLHPSAVSIRLDLAARSITDVVQVARHASPITISPQSLAAMSASRRVVESRLNDGHAHYGINTGFGSLSRQRIPAEQLRQVQLNLVRSHAAGVGPPLAPEIVRATMFLLLASLCRGRSGVRPILAERLAAMLNAGVIPIVPEVGSVGASGDLAPLAHIALVLIGEGRATFRNTELDGHAALAAAGLTPLPLEAKEGLALINGTHLMAAQGALLLDEWHSLFSAAQIAAAMSIDACRGTDSFLDDRVHLARNQPGQRTVAARLRTLLAGSQIVESHKENDPRVQDPYSLRCTPQVLGAAADAADFVRACVERELGAVTDNPLVFDDDSDPPAAQNAGNHADSGPGSIISAGNFHGMPLAIPLDLLSIAVSHVAGVSERRVYFLLSATDPESHLRPYLSPVPGLHSGLMIAQYTAAACCNEIVGLAAPASVANIPTSAGVEDYNSFGPRAGAKARRAIDLARRVIAVELLAAAEGLEYHRPLRSGAGVEMAHAQVRDAVSRLTADRPLSHDIETIAALIKQGAFVA
jgi:histidine ammonia-lyase